MNQNTRNTKQFNGQTSESIEFNECTAETKKIQSVCVCRTEGDAIKHNIKHQAAVRRSLM